MSKDKAIPKGYMTVGEAAKRVGTTVRTLQYYDKAGIFSPSAESEGGRRLYTDKDIVGLHQIMSLKYLGFSLDDIKNRITSLDTPTDVAAALTDHAVSIKEKIESLSEALKAIEALKEEVHQMQSVDFKKYADIIINLQMENEMYWAIKHFDDDTLNHLRNRFNRESAPDFLETFKQLCKEAVQYQKDNIPPDSDKGQELAKAFWNMLMEFTGGDMKMLTKLMGAENSYGLDSEWKEKQTIANLFIEPALGAYFAKIGYNPLGDEEK